MPRQRIFKPNPTIPALDLTEPKKKKKGKGKPLRDGISNSIFEEILDAEIPKGTHKITWGRFKITCCLLYFSGFRINEIAQITPEQLEEAFETRKLQVFQSKVSETRIIVIPQTGIPVLKKIYEKHKEDVFGKHSVIFPLPSSERKNGEKFIQIINKCLKPFSDKHGLILKSHSFRINYVTQAIRHKSVESAQYLVGHADIRSTMKYNRYKQTPEEKDELLENMVGIKEN